jgi:hypothetical protein
MGADEIEEFPPRLPPFLRHPLAGGWL